MSDYTRADLVAFELARLRRLWERDRNPIYAWEPGEGAKRHPRKGYPAWRVPA
jgi:hypothetical protein